MAVILLDEAFSSHIRVKFSKRLVAMAFAGTAITGVLFRSGIGVLFGFTVVTAGLFLFKYYRASEIWAGILAAFLALPWKVHASSPETGGIQWQS
jgi:hypothetical protein